MPNTPKRAADSAVEMTEIVLPPHANTLGMLFGGQLAAWIDIASSVAARRHARNIVVTATMDDLHFMGPVHVGEVLTLKAHVNRAFNTSMEVGVGVEAESLMTGERRQTAVANLTFVAIDTDGNPVPVPPLLPETDAERRRFEQAEQRRVWRLDQRALLQHGDE